jgi:hypothetical protein
VVATAAPLATIPWAPEGPLPRRLVPVRLSSMASESGGPLHPAASRIRTLSGGAVCVLSVPEEGTGRHAALRVEADGSLQAPVWVEPETGEPGWEVVDFLGADDGSWTVLELLPGPPDRVQARGIAPDGTTLWREGATAGSPEALRQLVEGSLLGVTGARRLVAIEPGGAVTDVQELETGGDCFADGQGRLGFAAYNERTEARSWVTVAVGGGARAVIALDPASAWALDIPLGMDAHGRPYGNRQGALVRFGADGRIDWEAQADELVTDGELQTPRGPAVTADGSIDLATRAADGLRLVRVTPAAG